MWAVATIGRVMEPDGLVRDANIILGSKIRGGWWTRLGQSKSTAIFAANGSTAAAKVERPRT